MEESNRNTRTLIVSFVFAIMAMIPLRFVEAGQMMKTSFTPPSRSAVLGEIDEAVILPNAELESPYNVIDGAVIGEAEVIDEVADSDCILKSDADVLVSSIGEEMMNESLSEVELADLMSELMLISESVCK